MAELKDTRRALMEDYQISPDLVSKCQSTIEHQCGGGVQREGKTLHCLMDLARQRVAPGEDDVLKPECRREVRILVF